MYYYTSKVKSSFVYVPVGLYDNAGWPVVEISNFTREKEAKSEWWMPWLWEAKKDVVSCDKPRVGANDL